MSKLLENPKIFLNVLKYQGHLSKIPNFSFCLVEKILLYIPICSTNEGLSTFQNAG